MSEMMTFSLQYLQNWSKQDKANIQYHITFKPVESNITYDGHNFYSVVGFELILKRYYVLHIMSYYIPCTLFVAMSWISFIIPPEVIPGRMTLLITLLLVLVNLFGTVITKQPSSNSTTLVAIWTISCIMFVTAALCAYTIVLWKQKQQYKNLPKKHPNVSRVNPINENGPGKSTNKDDQDPIDMTSIWDGNCLKIFPSAFLIFNAIYWTIVIAKPMF